MAFPTLFEGIGRPSPLGHQLDFQPNPVMVLMRLLKPASTVKLHSMTRESDLVFIARGPSGFQTKTSSSMMVPLRHYWTLRRSREANSKMDTFLWPRQAHCHLMLRTLNQWEWSQPCPKSGQPYRLPLGLFPEEAVLSPTTA